MILKENEVAESANGLTAAWRMCKTILLRIL